MDIKGLFTRARASSAPRPPAPRPKLPRGPAWGHYRLNPLSWIVFGILMAWNIWSFLPRDASQVALPYSAFAAQVAGGNVSAVRIVGDEITGTFVKAIVWTEPAKAGATTAGEAPKAPAYS